jgi:hypothetical protein
MAPLLAAEEAKIRTSIANDLRLSPQARTVLLHLEKYGSISPSEAQVSHHIFRLAARILELRKAGYEITTENKRDAAGQPYGRYWLNGKKPGWLENA